MIPGSATTMHDERRWQLLSVVALLAMAAPLVPWFIGRSTASEAWTGLLLLAVGAVVAARVPAGPAAPARPWTTVVLASSAAAVFVVGVVVDVRLLQAAGLAAATAALVPVWRPGRPLPVAALVLIGLGLPLSGDIDVVGFPLRRLSAELAALALPVLGVPVAFAETVLVTEHGLADVEAPCAGLSTLRLLLAAVAVIAALRGARTGALVAASAAAIVVAVIGNASRVTILSFLVLGAQAPDLAALLHVPLGVIVFLAAATAALPLLGPAPTPPTSTAAALAGARPLVVLTVVAAALGGVAVRASRPAVVRPEATAPLPRIASADDLPLSRAEQELYGRHAERAHKRRLHDDAGRPVGEVLLVVTRGLRAIHAPERCLAGNGHAVVDSGVVVRAGQPVKRLVLDGGRFVGLSLLRSARGRVATDLGEVALARLGLGAGDRDDGPWVFVSAVVAREFVTVAGEEALVARLVDDATALLVQPVGSPP